MSNRSQHSRSAMASSEGRSPALLASVFESLASSLVVFDRNLRIVRRNRAAHLILPAGEDVSELLSRLTMEGTCIDWKSELRGLIQSPHSRQFDALAPRGKDQPDAYLQIVITPLRGEASDEILGGMLLADDVTARISMERRLAVSERLAAVGQLAARVAHELNNPLDGILRFANLGLRRAEALADADTTRYLESIKTGVTRMAQILGSLLEFSRSTPGTFEHATVNRIVEDALAAMEGRIRDAGITVVCNFHQADTPLMRGSSLFQVQCNLIKNAVDAMSGGGTLTITTDMVDGDIVVMVEDTGVGLPKDMERIFEPFFTTKTEGRGTGLGLAVCRDLIERLGGTILAARRQPKGTTMTVRIPVKNAGKAQTGLDARSMA